MRILIVDTLYPAFIDSVPFSKASTYEVELRKILDYKFGTFDAFSSNLRALGHECMDVIYNHPDLQHMWASENFAGKGRFGEYILDLQIEKFRPDVVLLQDLSVKFFSEKAFILAAQCSCRIDWGENVRRLDVAFTSFPFYVKKFEDVGVRGVYLPLAFEPSVLDGPQPERDIDISFVGGAGKNSHWKYGTDVLEAVAERFGERFFWFGYGLDNLSQASALRECYHGPCWGRDMYSVYRRSRIGITRHGEVANGYTNNLRAYEVTGSGALLMTEESPNLKDLFPEGTVVPYSSGADLCDKIDHFLANENARATAAAWGQAHTLTHHTYEVRMRQVSEVLTGALMATTVTDRR